MRKPAPCKCKLVAFWTLELVGSQNVPVPLQQSNPRSSQYCCCVWQEMFLPDVTGPKNVLFSHRFTQYKCKSPRCHQDVVFFSQLWKKLQQNWFICNPCWKTFNLFLLEASDIMKSIGEAIQFLHAINIAHRDVKVNIIILKMGLFLSQLRKRSSGEVIRMTAFISN